MPLRLFRTSIQRSEAGVLKTLANASCTIYKTMAGDIAPIDSSGTVNVAATKATIYSDRNGTTQKSNPVTSDIQGYIDFYSDQTEFHILVKLADGTTFGLLWVPHISRPAVLVNALDYPTIEAAIAATPAFGKCYFPARVGGYTPASAAGVTLARPIEIYGDGELINEDECFNWFKPGAADSYYDSIIFDIASGISKVYIHDVIFRGAGASQRSVDYQTLGKGSAIRYKADAVASNFRFERIAIFRPGGNGIHLDAGASGYIVDLNMSEVSSSIGKAHGFYINRATGLVMNNCTATSNRLGGLFVKDTGQGVIQIEVGQCCKDSTDTLKEGHVVLQNCADIVLQGCNCEAFIYDGSGATPLTVKNGFVLFNCRGCIVQGNEFDGELHVNNVNSRAIFLYGDSTDPWDGVGNIGNFIGCNAIAGVARAVEINDVTSNYGNVVMPQGVLYTDSVSTCRIVIPALSRNFAFISAQPSGIHNGQGVGILYPAVPDVTALHATDLREGMIAYDVATGKFKGYAAAGGLGWKDFHN